MTYIFLVVAALWAFQFLLSYWQLRAFHRGLSELRKLGRCAVGMHGNRWRGRTYGVLVLDDHDRVRQAALFNGWTVFAKLRPTDVLNGTRLDAILSSDVPQADLHATQWAALQNAAQFFVKKAASPQLADAPTS